MNALASQHTSVLSSAADWAWHYSPALAPLAERVFQCVAQEGRESAQRAGWRGSKEHSWTDSFRSSELLHQTAH